MLCKVFCIWLSGFAFIPLSPYRCQQKIGFSSRHSSSCFTKYHRHAKRTHSHLQQLSCDELRFVDCGFPRQERGFLAGGED